MAASKTGDVTQLGPFVRQGFTASEPSMLIRAVMNLLMRGAEPATGLSVVNCLVEELGADVNRATNSGAFPLIIAGSQPSKANLMRRCA